MELKSILIILALGAVVGWLAGFIVRGGGFGLIVNIIVGVLGAFVGNYICDSRIHHRLQSTVFSTSDRVEHKLHMRVLRHTLSLYTAIPMLASFYIYTATSQGIANYTNSNMAASGGAAGAGAGMRSGVIGSARSAGRSALAVGSGVKKLTQK